MNATKQQFRHSLLLVLLLAIAFDLPAAEKAHVVKRGENVSSIAERYGVSVNAIVQRNQLKAADRVMIGQRLIIPVQSVSVEYVVQPGDSVASIAARHGVTMAAVIDTNKIKDPNRIVVGQKLFIPAQRGAPATLGKSLSPGLKASLDRIGVRRGRWQKIVIHHSGSAVDTPASMDRYHRARQMENGLAYHFVIGNGARTRDGEIHVGNRWLQQLDGGHLASSALNQQSIGICLVGDFNNATPTRQQMDALQALVGYLMERCKVPRSGVVTHQQINTKPTECPGSKFPTRNFLSELNP